MDQDNINRINAAKTTVSYCETTASQTASNSAFGPKVAFIKGKIVLVEGFNQLSDTPIKGVTLNVEGIRGSMIQEVWPLASAVFAYAADLTPADEDLMAQAKVTKTYLEDCSKEKCATECRRLVTLAQANAANILPLGITASDITDADNSVTLYQNVINDPRAAIINRANAGEQAVEGLNKIMNVYLAKQLDAMANILRFSNNPWWKAYRMSREIIDLGTTFTKLRVTCEDVEGDPIKGVMVSLLQGGVVIYSKKTGADGKASIVKVEPGDYDIRFEKTGFITQTEVEYHFAPGSEKIHHIVLEESSAATPLDPPGYVVQQFNIPAGGSVVAPFDNPGSIPPSFQLYLLCTNGNAIVCTTNLPAIPCASGYQLNQGVPFQGAASSLNLDLSKSHIQFTNPGATDIIVRAGVPE